MSQKQLILSVLEKLKPYRDMADIFMSWIQSWMYDKKFIESLSSSLHKAMEKVNWWVELEKFKQASTIIEKIQFNENRKWEVDDADTLLESL